MNYKVIHNVCIEVNCVTAKDYFTLLFLSREPMKAADIATLLN